MHTRVPLLLLLAATPVLAHTDVAVHSHLTGFWAGAAHPWTGPDHLVAMLAVGLWSAVALRQPLRAPLAFAASLLAGALLALLSGWEPPAMEAGITASLAVLGLLVGLRVGLPSAAGVAMAAVLAFSHGLAHGMELQSLAALGGMAFSTLILHVLGLALGWTLRGAPARAHALLGAGVAAVALARVIG